MDTCVSLEHISPPTYISIWFLFIRENNKSGCFLRVLITVNPLPNHGPNYWQNDALQTAKTNRLVTLSNILPLHSCRLNSSLILNVNRQSHFIYTTPSPTPGQRLYVSHLACHCFIASVLTEGGDVTPYLHWLTVRDSPVFKCSCQSFQGFGSFSLNLRLFTVRQIERSPQSNPDWI